MAKDKTDTNNALAVIAHVLNIERSLSMEFGCVWILTNAYRMSMAVKHRCTV